MLSVARLSVYVEISVTLTVSKYHMALLVFSSKPNSLNDASNFVSCEWIVIYDKH